MDGDDGLDFRQRTSLRPSPTHCSPGGSVKSSYCPPPLHPVILVAHPALFFLPSTFERLHFLLGGVMLQRSSATFFSSW